MHTVHKLRTNYAKDYQQYAKTMQKLCKSRNNYAKYANVPKNMQTLCTLRKFTPKSCKNAAKLRINNAQNQITLYLCNNYT